jgi:CheY-like chemotaxis protein
VKDGEIPKTEEVPVNAGIQSKTESKIGSPPRILVADDDNDLRRLCVELLVDAGYEATGVPDGAAAWEELQSNDYDLVITDNKMPKMTGVEMLEKIRIAGLPLPVIMATGIIPTQVFSRQPWLQPDGMLERPFSDADLLDSVKKVLRREENYNAHIRILLRSHV